MNEKAIRVFDLVEEFAGAEDAISEDIGTRSRTPLVILRELVVAVQEARPSLLKAGDIVEIEVPSRSSTSKNGINYRGKLLDTKQEMT